MCAHHNMKPLRLLVLVAIGAVLIGTLVSFLRLRKNRAGVGDADAGAKPVVPLRGEVDQQTRAFSLAKTEGDHTLYTIKADQVTTLKQTQKNLLHGVVVDIFGRGGEKSGTRHDRITTAECEYDPVAQTLWVPGNVEMNFELPASSAANGEAGNSSANSNEISAKRRVVIHTSQLSFDQSTGNATTDADVQFTFPEGTGRSRGARYDSQQQTLHLVSAVEFVLQGDKGGDAAPTTIHAGELRYLRNEGRIALDKSVDVAKETRRVRSQSGTIWLSEDNQVRRAELLGNVQASELSDTASASARAARANLDFGDAGTIRNVELLESVSWQMGGGKGSSAPPLREGRSQRMLLAFEPASTGAQTSELDHAVATGNVQITLRSRASRMPSRGENSAGVTAGQSQVLSGQEAEMQFAQGGKLLRDAKLRGAPRIDMYEAQGGAPRTITANNFDFDFGTQGQLTQINATENVRVTSPVPATATTKTDTRVTTSNNLLAAVDSSSGKLKSLRQSGNFTYQDSARKAQAAVATYQADEELLTLERGPNEKTGGNSSPPAITQAEGRIAADVIKLFTRSGNLEASGAVATTSTPAPDAGPSAPGLAPSANASKEPVHAVADQLRYDELTKTAYYSGHTRLWQGTGFLLESESATMDRTKSLLTAIGSVLTIFRPPAPTPNEAKEKGAKSGAVGKPAGSAAAAYPAGTYVVRSDQVTYAQPAGRIVYQGNVRANQDGGSLTSKSMEIILKNASGPAASDLQGTASRIDKMIAREDVKLSESGRVGTGDTAEYFADSRKVNLYGKPATLSDPERGSTKGVQLTYQIGDNRASVVGNGGEQTETRWIPNK